MAGPEPAVTEWKHGPGPNHCVPTCQKFRPNHGEYPAGAAAAAVDSEYNSIRAHDLRVPCPGLRIRGDAGSLAAAACPRLPVTGSRQRAAGPGPDGPG